ncbi:MAG TPA: hypothetical protein VIW07_15280 [Candidatus Udaeobacter sp.]
MRCNRSDSHPVAGIPVAIIEHELGDAGLVGQAQMLLRVHLLRDQTEETLPFLEKLAPQISGRRVT